MIKGMTIYLLNRVQTGLDKFNHPTYSETEEEVGNVLVGEPTTDDIDTAVSLYGKKVSYMLGIPKGDTHNWTDARVKIRGEIYKTIGYPIEGIEENIPLFWNKKVRVERVG